MNVSRRAFTLVELLVCILVVMVLLSLLRVGLSGAWRRAGDARCLANLRSVSQATAAYLAGHRYVLPSEWEAIDVDPYRLVCPRDPERSVYVLCDESETAGVVSTLSRAAGAECEVVIVSDRGGWHSGRRFLGFLDGHASPEGVAR